MPACPDCKSSHPDGTETCPVDGATLVPDAVLAAQAKYEIHPGTLIGEYRIEEKIGEGGFGSVYRAVHPLIGKAVAVKLLSHVYSDNAQIVSRFIAEARAVNQIRHKNIVDIFSFGALPDGRQYFVMELLLGKPLDGLLDEKERLSLAETVPIMRGVLKALAAAHAAGLVHRDLKPANVFLCIDDEGVVTPKLIDFGIAKLLGDDTVEHRTRTGTPMGTPYYMSPEQCRGKNVDHRADLYSIGAMLHVLLTGKKPFVGDSAMDLLYKQMTEPPPRLSEHHQGFPRALEELVLSLLSKNPKDRPQSALETAKRLDEILAHDGTDHTMPMPGAVSPRTPVSEDVTFVPAKPTLQSKPQERTQPSPGSATADPAETRIEAIAPTPPARIGPLPIGIGIGLVAATAIAFFAWKGDASTSPSSTDDSSSALVVPSTDASAVPIVALTQRPEVSPAPSARPSSTPVVTPTDSVVVMPAPPTITLKSQATPPSSASAKPKPAATFNPNDVIFDE